jgi:AraC-like DNA-binding protein
MPQTVEQLRETNIVGKSQQWGVSAVSCPLLAQHHIAHIGFGEIAPEYRIVRLNPDFAHVNLCWGGEGRLLINGQWKPVREGALALFPANIPHGGRPAEKREWKIAWVIYREPAGMRPTIGGKTSSIVQVDPRPLEWAIKGLYREVSGAGDPAVLQHWADLIHWFVRRHARPKAEDARLWRVWDQVDADIARDWTLPELARLANMSEVHLRRVCLAETGRTPTAQLAYLRMRRAAYLLATTDQTVEAIAWSVCYQSISSFSAAFQQTHGMRPSAFRRRAATRGNGATPGSA